MGYQALLFCPDEKLARVVSQVFADLDFGIEHVQEPFAAVKRLMAQRYDAVVVDCENEPNATLLFKSARTSSANQSSLAIAVVEGQAGVAKAYRIGANLVLTKPINVEQAKGTLRVARGLLRKTADTAAPSHVNPLAANAATPAATAPAATAPTASVPENAVSRSVEPVASPANQSARPEFETQLPHMAASAKAVETPLAAPASEVQAKPSLTAQPLAEGRIVPEPAKTTAEPIASKASENPAASLSKGAAAAPAPARETPAEKKTVEFEAAYQKDAGAPALSSASATDGPSFAALDDEHAGGSGGSKKIMVAAAVILALAALGYVGWSKLSTPKTSVTPPPLSAPQPSRQPTAPPTAAPISMSVPATTPATGPTNRAGTNTLAGTSQTAVPSAAVPAAAASPTVLRIDASPEADTKKPGPKPIVVKSIPGKKTMKGTEEGAALPSPLEVAATNDGMSGMTIPATHSQPSLVKVHISQGVSQGLVIKRVQPKYPSNALAMHLQGEVQLDATINKEGNIVNLKVLKGDPVLAHAAMDAVRQWRYKPYYLDRAPVDIETQITVNFKLPH